MTRVSGFLSGMRVFAATARIVVSAHPPRLIGRLVGRAEVFCELVVRIKSLSADRTGLHYSEFLHFDITKLKCH